MKIAGRLHIDSINSFLHFDDAVKSALQQLHVLLHEQHTLNSNEIKNWIKRNQLLYEKQLLSFNIWYLGHEYTTEGKIYVSESNIFVDASPFKYIIIFCEIQSLLIGNGYHLTDEEEQLMLNDYYYQPNRNPEEHLKLIKEYLIALDERYNAN